MHKVMGIFYEEDTAQSVLLQFEESGLPYSRGYGIALRNKQRTGGVMNSAGLYASPLTEHKSGFSVGGILGGALAGLGTLGIAAPIAGAAIGTAAIIFLSAASGAMVGGMIEMGLSRNKASEYSRKIEKGSVLVVIEDVPKMWLEQAKSIFIENGGHDIEII